ncbi:MAG: Transcriptional regulatory protein ZraR [Rhodocyclaceae bacterium]|nr:Transcriptional regulatory protein ZraR [Rhodocyclaceae bacterium]
MAKILVVDDEVGIRELLMEILREESYDVRMAENAAAARALRSDWHPDLILLDIWMPDTDGLTLLKEWVAAGPPGIPVVMMSGHGSIETAIEATRAGALDYLEKPISLQKLLAAVRRGLQRTQQRSASPPTLNLFSRSSLLKDLNKRLQQMSARSRLVTLRSHPGGIAEICARTLSPKGRGFLDLTTLPGSLDVQQLDSMRGGMLFVPELASLTRIQQKNMLFAMDRLAHYDLRMVVATARSWDELAEAGWDEPTLCRLTEAIVAMPALNDLRSEIPDIAQQVLAYLVETGVVPPRRFDAGALSTLRNVIWSGGYAGFTAVIRALALNALEHEIGREDIRRLMAPIPGHTMPLPLDQPLREAREAFERVYFEYHLKLEGGNMTRLAEKAGLERTHLYRKLKQLGIQPGRRGEHEPTQVADSVAGVEREEGELARDRQSAMTSEGGAR